jgi:hypothetical protein
MTYFGQVLNLFSSSGIEYIVVGGLAASMHGSVRFTDDLDVVYRRTPDNIKRLADALGALRPSLPGALKAYLFVSTSQPSKRGSISR